MGKEELQTYLQLEDTLNDLHTNDFNPLSENNTPNLQNLLANQPRKTGVKAGKSRNVAKFAFRMFRKRFRNFKPLFQDHPHLYHALEKRIQALRNWEKLNPRSNAVGLTHLHELMGAAEGEAGVEAAYARLALTKMISSSLKEEVLRNKRCSQKMLHLNTLKLLQLRCMSPVLVSRMQIQ